MKGHFLKASVGFLLFSVILWKIDLSITLSLICSANLIYVCSALILALVGILISTWKWSLLLGIDQLSFSYMKLLRLFWIGVFFNNLLPGRIGGDLIRAFGLGLQGPNQTKALLSVAIDRGLNLIALFGIGTLSILINPGVLPDLIRTQLLTWSIRFCLGALLILGIGFYFSNWTYRKTRIGQVLANFYTAGARLLNHPTVCLTAFSFSLCYHSTVILSNYSIAKGLGLTVTPDAFFCLIPITALITLLPISLNGFGLREGAYAFFFTKVGITVEEAVAISLAITFCMVGTSLVGGILYITGRTTIKSKPSSKLNKFAFTHTLSTDRKQADTTDNIRLT